MTLYTKKKGQYQELTREQVRRLRRVNEVIELQTKANTLMRTTRALAAWLETVQKKHLKLDAKDLAVTRLPNVERLRSLCDAVDKASKTLENV